MQRATEKLPFFYAIFFEILISKQANNRDPIAIGFDFIFSIKELDTLILF